MKKSLALVIAVTCLTGLAQEPNLLVNGSFESSPMGTTATLTALTPANDSTTFSGWYFFNVGSPAINRFTGTIVDAGSYAGGTPGSHAIRLEEDNTGSPVANDYGLAVAPFPVVVGTHYTLAFDLELDSVTGGTEACEVTIAEFDVNGKWLGNVVPGYHPALALDKKFHHYTTDYIVQNASTAKVNIAFRPRNPGFKSVLVLDHVVLTKAGLSAGQSVQKATESAPASDLLVNGSFESTAIGTATTLTAPTAAEDAKTFAGWRFFSVGSPPISGFSGTIVDAGKYKGGQPGSHALRLDVDNTSSPAGSDYALDTALPWIPVTTGAHYTLSFDLELDGVTGGTMVCDASIAEFRADGSFTGSQTDYALTLPVDATFHHYSKDFVVRDAETAKVVVAFRPKNPGYKSALVLDNVVLAPAKVSAGQTDQDATGGYRQLRDVQYGLASNTPLLMNITIPNPKPGKPVPAVVLLHGGGWSGGTRENMMNQCFLVAQHGYVGASVEYRLSGQAPFPACLQDCKAAVRYLRANAGKYGIDPDRISVWGCSAGGHLAAMLGLTENIAEFEGDGGNPGVSSRVQLVVDCFGPTDFDTWAEIVNKWADDEQARRLFAPPPPDDAMFQWWKNFGLEKDPPLIKMFEGKGKERAKWASPITYANRKENVPPFLFMHGSVDTWVPLQQSILLANALEKNGVDVTFLLKINSGHDDSKAWPEILEYLKKKLPLPSTAKE
jgi:acetyl esterase/lipase